MHSNVFGDRGWSVSSTPSYRDQVEQKNKEILSELRTDVLLRGYMQNFKQWKALVILTCLVALASPAFGQAVYGSMYGTVTDPTGSVVPNATVTVTDVAKGTSVTATANDSGGYSVEHLIPDVYDVKVTAPGFKASET